jgi:hypothetical protein
MKTVSFWGVFAVFALAAALSLSLSGSGSLAQQRRTRYTVWNNDKFCVRTVTVTDIDKGASPPRVIRVTALRACRTALKRAVGLLFFQIESNWGLRYYSPSVHLFAVSATNGGFETSVAAFQTYASLDGVVEYRSDAASPGFDETRGRASCASDCCKPETSGKE